MIDRIKKHIEERDSIIEKLKTIMVYCNNSPISLDFLHKKWAIVNDELHLQVSDCDLDEDYYGYEISSMGAKGEQFFMGEKDGYTYVMAHDGDWEKTQVFVLDNKNRVVYE